MMLLKLKNTVNPINDTENNTGKDFEDLTIETNEEEKMEYIGDETPRGSVFALDVKKKSLPEGWDIAINETTGDITVSSPEEITQENIIKVPVSKTLPDGKTVNMVATITFIQEDEETSTPETEVNNNAEENKEQKSDPTDNQVDVTPSQVVQADGNQTNPESEDSADNVLGKVGPHTSTGGHVDNIWTWIANVVK